MTELEPDSIEELLERLWIRITRIAGELNEATGIGVLVATRFPNGVVLVTGERGSRFYLNIPPRNSGDWEGVKVMPEDCGRCCLDYYSIHSANQEKEQHKMYGNIVYPSVASYLRADYPVIKEDFYESKSDVHETTARLESDSYESWSVQPVHETTARVESDRYESWSVQPIHETTARAESDSFTVSTKVSVIMKIVGKVVVPTKQEDPENSNFTGEIVQEEIDQDLANKDSELKGRRGRPPKKKVDQGKRVFKTIECDLCGKVLSRTNHLRQHLLTHSKSSSFECFCGKVCRSEKILQSHERIAHGEKRFKCEECGKEFQFKAQLNNHVWIHRDMKRFKCHICEREFKTRRNFKCHMRIHDEGANPYKCDDCSIEFSTDIALKKHLERKHSDKAPSFLCSECGKKFNHPQNLKRHFLIHTGIKPFKCRDCGKAFNQLTVLEAHKVLHTGVTPFMCSDCGKTFSRAIYLKRHLSVHDGSQLFKCEKCGKVLKSLQSLTAHQKKHTESRLFKCTVCGMEFRYEKAFNSHMESHSDISLETKCYICGEEFDFNFRLRIHMRNHIDKGGPEYGTNASLDVQMDSNSEHTLEIDDDLLMHSPNNNPIQSKSYLSISVYKISNTSTSTINKASHTVKPKSKVTDQKQVAEAKFDFPNSSKKSADKTIKCAECGKEFYLHGNYKRHMLIHTGEKPFKCDICGKDFRQRVALNVHIRTHTRGQSQTSAVLANLG